MSHKGLGASLMGNPGQTRRPNLIEACSIDRYQVELVIHLSRGSTKMSSDDTAIPISSIRGILANDPKGAPRKSTHSISPQLNGSSLLSDGSPGDYMSDQSRSPRLELGRHPNDNDPRAKAGKGKHTIGHASVNERGTTTTKSTLPLQWACMKSQMNSPSQMEP